MLVSGQTLEGQLLAKAAQFDAAMVAKDKNAAKETYFFDSIKNTYAGFIERSHHIANHILVSFHAAFIFSLLSLPAGGVRNWSEAMKFVFASPETFISLAFLWLSWHSNIAIHEMGHYIKAVQLDALSAKLLPQAKQELAEANKGPLNKALYLIKMFFKTPYGKQPGIIKNGLNYYVDAPYNLSVAAAGPLTSLKYTAIPGLTMMGIMIAAGLSTGMNDLVYAGRAFLGIGAVGLLDYFLTDPGAKEAYKAQMKQQQENAEQVAQKSQATGAWIDQLPEIKNKLVNTRPQEVQVTVNGVTERLRAPWQYRNSGMGGKHTEAEFPKSNISFQETMFLPLKYADYGEFQEMTVKCQKTLKDLIEASENGQVMGIGLEGGVVPYLDRKWHDKDGDHEVPVPDLRLWLLAKQAIIKSGFVPGVDVGIALDPAVSELENAYREETGKEDAVGMYMFWRDKEKIVMTTDELLQLFHDAIFKYDIPIVSIEDGMAEDDYRGWKLLNEKFGKYMPIIADDVATTNDKTVDTLAEEGLANSLLVKFNQIGSLSEGILAVLNALGKGWTIVSSHRSKSPNDDMEAQVGMGFNAMGVKMGGGNNTERLFKYSAVMAVMTKAIADAKEHFKNKIEADSVFKKSSEEFIKNMQITKILAVEKPTNAGIPTVGVQVFFSIPGLDGLNYTFEGATPLGTSAGTGEAIHLTDDIIYPAQVPQGVESDQLFDKTKDGSLRFKKSIKQNDIDAIKNPALSELFRRSKRYNGKGNLNAVDNVLNIVSKFFVGKKLSEIGSIQSIDTELLKMEEDLARERGLLSANASDEERIAIMQRKGQIGMNALLSSSLALSRLVAAMQGKDLWQLIREQAKDIIARTIEHNGGLSILPDELSAKVQVADGQSLSDALVHSLSLDELVVGLQAVDKNRAPNVRLYQLLRQEMNVYRVDYSKTPVRPDSAMFSRGVKNRIAAIKTKDVGGIYINPKMFDMQIKKDNNGVPLPVAQQPMMKMNVDGFIPVFIYDHPFNGLSTFLGLTAAASKKPEELAKV
jgi:enolase